ncbi:MAG TPA: hypothetical protein VJB90_02720 [Candidatus Nanoarchaeia archaeon]|nr:hypothetical protein [Candidatus Nanoarchaeia archaeon]
MVKVSTETPVFEITLRKYEKPESVSGRDLVKKICLSLGLLQPGDSRDVIVDILYVLLKRRPKGFTSQELEKEVIKFREQNKLALLGIASSNIRRQLRRLRALFIVEKTLKRYRITEGDALAAIFSERIKSFLLPSTLSRVEEYLAAADAEFSKKR